jgi:micrococcal nuclease
MKGSIISRSLLRPLAALAVLLLPEALFHAGCNSSEALVFPQEKGAGAAQTELFNIVKIVDGDTVWIATEGNKEKVRMLCVDTPETSEKKKHPLGFKAKEFTRKLLKGKKVRLRKDPKQGDRDKYGRLLRYLFTKQGMNVSLEIVASGWSAYYVKYGKSSLYHDELIQAENEAKKAKLGIWADPVFLAGGYLANAYGKEL